MYYVIYQIWLSDLSEDRASVVVTTHGNFVCLAVYSLTETSSTLTT